jgi:SOS-response transcriptional repressor LexA
VQDLTDRQAELYRYCRDHFTTEQRFPTYREIAKHFDFESTNAVKCHLDALIKKGYLGRGMSADDNVRVSFLRFNRAKVQLVNCA